MQLTRMPSGAHSTATVRVAPMMPARAATVCATPGMPRSMTTTMLQIDRSIGSAAAPRSRQYCAARCIISQVPLRLLLMTALQPLGAKSIAACGNCPPALLTVQSMRP